MRESHPFLRQFGLGFGASTVGCYRVLTDPATRNTLWRHFKSLALLSIASYILLSLFFFPLRVLSRLFVLESAVDEWKRLLSTLVPLALVTACRMFRPETIEHALFAGLALRNKELASRVQRVKPVRWDWRRNLRTLFYIFCQLSLSILLILISPILGPFVPLIEFGYGTRRMQMMYWLPLFLGFYLNATRPIAMQLARLWMQARAVSRELLQPVHCRQKRATKKKQRISRKCRGFFVDYKNIFGCVPMKEERFDIQPESEHEEALFAEELALSRGKSESARTGFAFYFSLMLQIPIAGPFIWYLAFMTTGFYACELADMSCFTLESEEEHKKGR